MPSSRVATIGRLASTVADGRIPLDEGADPQELRDGLLQIKGIGPWTADYVLMRALGHPDVLLAGDLGVIRSATRLGLDAPLDPRRWSPWSSYAVHHLWAADHGPTRRKDDG